MIPKSCVRLVAAAAAIALAVPATGCGTSSEQSAGDYALVDDGKLTVALYSEAPPFISSGDNDKLGAVDGTLLNGFAKKHNLTVVPYKTTFASTIQSVQQNKADIGTYIYYTPQRATQLYYTLPFLATPTAIFTRKGYDYTGPESMKGKTIGALQGTVQVPYLRDQKDIELQVFPSSVAQGQALLNGQIDGVITSAIAAPNEPLGGPKVDVTVLNRDDFGLPQSVVRATAYNVVSCKNQGLAKAFDKYVRSQEKSGELAKIVNAETEAAKERVGDEVKSSDLKAPLESPEQRC